MDSPANPADVYFFQRGHRSSIRLNYQHWMTRQVCGYLIHPDLPSQTPDIRIADIGTATGIWPIEALSSLHNTARIDGFDISTDQFPPKDLMPPNLHFYEQDAFKPFPEEFHGQYDIVNIRFFAPVMASDKVLPVLENFMAITKPGGYIQWFEPDMSATRPYAPTDSIPTSATQKLSMIMRRPTPETDFEWVPKLHTTFSSQGLEDVKKFKHPVPDMYKIFNGQTQLLAFEDINLKAEADGRAEQAKQGRLLYQELLSEYQQGASVDWDFICVTGRKPL